MAIHVSSFGFRVWVLGAVIDAHNMDVITFHASLQILFIFLVCSHDMNYTFVCDMHAWLEDLFSQLLGLHLRTDWQHLMDLDLKSAVLLDEQLLVLFTAQVNHQLRYTTNAAKHVAPFRNLEVDRPCVVWKKDNIWIALCFDWFDKIKEFLKTLLFEEVELSYSSNSFFQDEFVELLSLEVLWKIDVAVVYLEYVRVFSSR